MNFQAVGLVGRGETGTLPSGWSRSGLRLYLRVACVGKSGYMELLLRESCEEGEGLSVFVFLRCGRQVAAVRLWDLVFLVRLLVNVSVKGGFAVLS